MFPTGNWKLYCALTILFWGLWTFFAKIASSSQKPATIGIWVGIVNLAILGGLGWREMEGFRTPGTAWSILAGLAAGLGGYFFFQAIRLAEANVVVPVTSLNMLVAAGLAIFFLDESVTWNKIAGYVLGGLSLFFLCR